MQWVHLDIESFFYTDDSVVLVPCNGFESMVRLDLSQQAPCLIKTSLIGLTSANIARVSSRRLHQRSGVSPITIEAKLGILIGV